MDPHRVILLGVPIDPVTQTEAIAQIQAMIHSPGQDHVMTPNSEMLVEARRNKPFRDLLNRTALNIPDSAGLLWAARRTGQRLPERVTGVDTVQLLCNELTSDESVFFLGAAPGVAEKTAQNLRMKNKGLNIAGTFAGSPRDEDAPAIIKRVNDSGAKLLLVAYGAPTQDLWIEKHLHTMPSVRVAMGVGGTFDFIAGVRKRAPRIMRQLHLEWLWRLVREPRRIKRIFIAVLVFPLLILRVKA